MIHPTSKASNDGSRGVWIVPMGYANNWDVWHDFFDEVIFAVGALQRFSRIGEELETRTPSWTTWARKASCYATARTEGSCRSCEVRPRGATRILFHRPA